MYPGQFQKPPLQGADPADVRFLELSARPWPDKKRVTFRVSLTPFNTAPSLEFKILSGKGRVLAQTMIIESPDKDIEFTMHLPAQEYEKPLTINAVVRYEEQSQVDSRSLVFDL